MNIKTLSRNIKTLLAPALLAGLTLITTGIDSAAQDTPALRERGVCAGKGSHDTGRN